MKWKSDDNGEDQLSWIFLFKTNIDKPVIGKIMK